MFFHKAAAYLASPCLEHMHAPPSVQYIQNKHHSECMVLTAQYDKLSLLTCYYILHPVYLYIKQILYLIENAIEKLKIHKITFIENTGIGIGIEILLKKCSHETMKYCLIKCLYNNMDTAILYSSSIILFTL